MDYIIIKNDNGYEEYAITQGLTIKDMIFGRSGTQLIRKTQQGYEEVTPYHFHTTEEGNVFFFLEDNTKHYQRNEWISIDNEHAEINIKDLPYSILLEKEEVSIEQHAEAQMSICLNGKTMVYKKGNIRSGDVLFVDGAKITWLENEVLINAKEGRIETNLLELPPKQDPFEGFPKYKRSPRIIKRIADQTIEITKPPEKKVMSKGSILQVILPPLAMLCITVGISILMKRGIYVLMSVAGTVMTTVASTAKFISERKECKESNEKRLSLYESYLLSKRKEIYAAFETEKESYTYNYPSITHLNCMVNDYSERIYERNSNDDDFLTVSVGAMTDKTTFSIKVSYDELAMEKDDLEKEAYDLKQEFSYIYEKPVILDLKKAHLGLVGEKDIIHEQLKLIIAQIAFFHSYHDVEIIPIYQEKYEEEFDWMRWYPHLRIHAINVIGNINSERKRDQILGSLNQMIKDRKLKQEESKKEGRFLPHFVFIIDEPRMIMDHSIMEYLDKEGDSLGFSIIYTTHLRANLPENIGTIVMLDNSKQGTLLLKEKIAMHQVFALNRIGDVNLEWMARNLSVLVHMQGLTSHIPESITFFDMYQVEKPSQLRIEERWRKNQSHKSLAVPLGVRAEEDYVYLNLHEKAHGPHGLVAGTTGSGKSEIVQSYILSLAVNFHPYEVGFLLIDYKGGGMASLFKNLPHLLGTITNLDGSESMRAMASIKSELARRQRIFNEYGVNHINGYNKLFKNGKATEPMPHLFLISDEFAELKKEQPEFMSELVSAARIGRSLGIHLILATQKPTGVVDDQIWTNSKFKLALKVQNESDSKEILKTPDAANITQAGRAYLQVGNNEIYELFQSAWSGASYCEDLEEEQIDDRVYILNDLGQGELLNQDLSGGQESSQIQKTQLDVVVDCIKAIFDNKGLESVKRPWLPSLPEQLMSPHIDSREIRDVKQYEELDMEVAIGLVDVPEQQLQTECQINFIEEGNLVLFGASGYGKSVLLTTLILSLALKNNPKLLKFYILDLGNAALISLKDLPHTADYMRMDDMEKLHKLVRILEGEIKTRKQQLAQKSAVNFDMYNRMAEEKLPAILWVIDNFDVLKEIDQDLEGVITQISRDGTSLGIYMVIAASRPGAVRYTLLNNFKNKIALYMFDKADMTSVVGRTDYPLSERKGRGLVKLENTNQIQIYLSAPCENVIAYIDEIKKIVTVCNERFTGQRAENIPMIPEKLSNAVLQEYSKTAAPEYLIPIGLDTEEAKLQYLDLRNKKQIIVGGSQTGKTNLLRVLLENRSVSIKTYIIDSKAMELYPYQKKENVTYIQNVEGILQLLEELSMVEQQRHSGYEEAAKKDSNLLPKQYYEQQELILIVIDDWEDFVAMLTASKNINAEKIITEAPTVNITMITTTPSNKMKGFDNYSKFMREAIYGMILGNPVEQNLYQVSHTMRVKAEQGIAYLYQKGELKRIKVPKTENVE